MTKKTDTPHLFSPLQLRGLRLRNRIALSPMCQYSSPEGLATDWHLTHLGSRAVGGTGLIVTEATAVAPCGRISPQDLGLWDDRQIQPLARAITFVKKMGAAAGVQLAHAGRKASAQIAWEGGAPLTQAQGAWPVLGPSPIPFAAGHPTPLAMDESTIRTVIEEFRTAALRALVVGFDLIEIHAAHGYLLNSFLSPLSNQRTDCYGGSFENRIRLLMEIVTVIRKTIPEAMPLLVRISATDWVEGGWEIEQSVALAKKLREAGVDLIDCSTGGLVSDAVIPAKPGFQVPFAERIRREAGIATAAVGLITEPKQAEAIISSGQADQVMLGRVLLRKPYWPLEAASQLGQEIAWPLPYSRARE